MTTFGVAALWGAALYHWIVGAMAMLSVSWTRRIAHALYRLRIPEDLDPGFEYAAKPIGAYALVVGTLCFWAVRQADPAVPIFVTRLMAALYLLRAAARFYYRDLFGRAFNVTPRRNIGHVAFNAVLAAATLAFGYHS